MNDIISPTPQTPNTGPEFITPGPTLTQRTALKIANTLMGGPKGAEPGQVLDRFVTEIGGYEPGKTDGRFGHEDAQHDTRVVALGMDETTRTHSAHEPTSLRAFHESNGLAGRGSAVSSTVRGERIAAGKERSFKATVTRKLVGHATRGGVYA